jgi:hypothetical protein
MILTAAGGSENGFGVHDITSRDVHESRTLEINWAAIAVIESPAEYPPGMNEPAISNHWSLNCGR